MITYSQTVLLDIDFPLILKLLVQIAYIFSAKHFSHRNASPKAFFLKTAFSLGRPQFKPDKDSGIPVQVYGLTLLITLLTSYA